MAFSVQDFYETPQITTPKFVKPRSPPNSSRQNGGNSSSPSITKTCTYKQKDKYSPDTSRKHPAKSESKLSRSPSPSRLLKPCSPSPRHSFSSPSPPTKLSSSQLPSSSTPRLSSLSSTPSRFSPASSSTTPDSNSQPTIDTFFQRTLEKKTTTPPTIKINIKKALVATPPALPKRVLAPLESNNKKFRTATAYTLQSKDSENIPPKTDVEQLDSDGFNFDDVIDVPETTDAVYFDIPGLKNIGNTCYMNSSFHALFVYDKFWDKFRSFLERIMNRSDAQSNQSYDMINSFSGLLESYNNAFLPMESCLRDFKRHFGRIHKNFNSAAPQDAPEFITCLIESICCFSEIGTKVDSRSNLISLRKFFYTHITSLQTCNLCGVEVRNVERNSAVLPLPFPDSTEPMSIADVFLKYFTSQHECECFKCKEESKAGLMKCKYILTEPSEGLILHLNRHNGETKIKKPVGPSEFLTISIDKDGVIRAKDDERVCKSYKYRLRALVCHHGQQFSNGHYVAYANFQNAQWYFCNDEEISPCDLDRVTQNTRFWSYLFFYELTDGQYARMSN